MSSGTRFRPRRMDLLRTTGGNEGRWGIHPVSITRFPLIIFSPGAGLLRNPFVYR